MENDNGQQDTAALVAQALEDFRRGVEYREQPSIRIGRRTTQIIRFGMTGLSVLGLVLFYLVFILTREFSHGIMAENIHHQSKPMKVLAF